MAPNSKNSASEKVKRATAIPAPLRIRPSQSFDGFDGKWSTFTVGVGTPPQNFRVLPATQVSETWVIDDLGCDSTDPTTCFSLRGGENFNGNPPLGYQGNLSSTWNQIGLYALETEKHLNITGNGEFGTDVVSVNGGNGTGSSDYPGVSLPSQLVAAVPDKKFFLGSFGLSARPSQFGSGAASQKTFLENLYQNKLIPSISFGYTAGAHYGENGKSNFGSLTIGGYDATRFQANRTLELPFNDRDAKPLTVGVQSIIVSGSLNGTASMTAGTNGHLSLIDSTVSQLWLPRSVCDNLAASFGLFYDNATDYYLINSTMHTRWQNENPTFTFKIGSKAIDDGKGINIILPYRAFDFSLGWPIYSREVNYFPIRRAANDTQYTLGRTLLQQAYLIVDYERKNFTLAPAAFPDTTTQSQIVTIKSIGGVKESNGLGAGAIAGIVVGAVAVILLAIGAFFFFRKRKQDRIHKAKIAELDGNGNKVDTAYAKLAADGVHEAGGGEVQELPGSGQFTGYAGKTQPAAAAELAAPAPVFEMEGEGTIYNTHGGRSPDISSAGTGYSPGRPSPARPDVPSPVGR